LKCILLVICMSYGSDQCLEDWIYSKKASFSSCLCFQHGRWMKLLSGNDQWKFFYLEDSNFCEDYILLHCKITGWKPGKYVSILFLNCKWLCVCVYMGGCCWGEGLLLSAYNYDSFLCYWLNLGITLLHVKDNLMYKTVEPGSKIFV